MDTDSPPPAIVQLRELLEGASALNTVGRSTLVARNLDLALALCDWLVDQHPSLTTAADGRGWAE